MTTSLDCPSRNLPRRSTSTLLLAGVFTTFLLAVPGLLCAQNGSERLALRSAMSPSRAGAVFAALAQDFEENRGQADARVRYLSRGLGYTLFLTQSEAVLSLNAGSSNGRMNGSRSTLRMAFVGGNRRAEIVAGDARHARSNYLTGANPAAWRTEVPHFGRVKYENIYPGVDLIYYGHQQELEYDLILAPAADPSQIRVRFQGVRRISIEANGDLALEMPGGVVRKRKPVAYQDVDGRRQPVEVSYALAGRNEVSFQLGRYDCERPLVIDPVLVYSTYFGGSGIESGFGIALDPAGNAYFGMQITTAKFPTLNPFQSNLAGSRDVFVAKLNPSGALVYATYLGGGGNDTGADLAVDAAGIVYLTGRTQSTNFPTLNPIQATLSGVGDAFVSALNAAGSGLVYSTYYGGSGNEFGLGIGVDAAGNAGVCGFTTSADFPVVNALQPARAANTDAFVLRLSATGTAAIYATYLGGGGADFANRLTVDSAGNAYVVGDTTSANFPRVNPLQSANAGSTDGFLSRIDPSGALLYSTYLGGSSSDALRDVKLDAAGNMYLTGETLSLNFPTVSPLQASNAGNYDVFVAKLNSSGSALLFSTYLGGSGEEHPIEMALDAGGSVYLIGYTLSTDFPTADPLQSTFGGNRDAFLAKLNSWGNTLLFSTYLGGSSLDQGSSVAVDGDGNAYLTGQTQSTNFPTAAALQPSFGGSSDAFVAKIATCSFSISPPDALFDSTGGSGDVLITTTAECPWTAASQAEWLTITSNASGVGNGTLSYSVAANATATTRTGTLVLGGQTFTVTQAPGAVTLASVSPAGGQAATNVNVTLLGSNFAPDAAVFAGPYIVVSNLVVVSTTEITATFAISTKAPPGTVQVTVTSSGNTSNPETFTVDAPVITTASLPSGIVSIPYNSAVNGAGGAQPYAWTISAGALPNGIALDSSTGAVTGSPTLAGTFNFTVTLTDANTATNSKAFSIVITPLKVPTLNSLNPPRGGQGKSVNVTLNGSNFIVGYTSITFDSPGITASNLVVVSATKITATFTIDPAATGSRQVRVVTPGGTSGFKVFDIYLPPTLSGISPASGSRGTTVAVTLTGTNLRAPITISVSGGGVTISSVVVVNSTTITANFAIGAGAALGNRNVTVSNAGGVSNPVTFTVN